MSENLAWDFDLEYITHKITFSVHAPEVATARREALSWVPVISNGLPGGELKLLTEHGRPI